MRSSMPAVRFGSRLAPDARWAVTAKLAAGNGVELEVWDWTRSGFLARPTGVAVDQTDQLLPLADGRILVCSSRGNLHAVDVIDRMSLARKRLANLACQAARVLAAAEGDLDARPWALCREGTSTTLTRLELDTDTESPGPGSSDVTVPGIYVGGVWTDQGGRSLALGHSERGRPCSSVELTIADGTTRTLFFVTDRSNDLVQLCASETKLAVASTDAGGTQRLGYQHLHSGEDWLFPDELAAPYGSIEAVAVDPGGSKILAHEQRGVRSLLHCFDVKNSEWTLLPVVPGALHGNPIWTRAGLVVPWSTPEVPLDFLEYSAGARTMSAFPLAPSRSIPTQSRIEVVTIPSAIGPIECIAYGGPDWIHLPKLVVALHGGPLEAWRLAYDPLLDLLARSGVGVLAVNPRGSSGYGYAFASAIRAGWGGVDLDDLFAVSRFLRAHREPQGLGLFGVSYGAFLALLITCLEPDSWDFCAALSGFASPVRLHADAGEPVRRLIKDMGGLNAPTGLDRPWDVQELAHRATARVLIVHGEFDETIDVRHARELAAAFASARGTFGDRTFYKEIPQAGHDLNWPDVWDLVCRFVDQPDEVV